MSMVESQIEELKIAKKIVYKNSVYCWDLASKETRKVIKAIDGAIKTIEILSEKARNCNGGE